MRRILILDDEPAVLNALRRTLRAAFAQEDVVIEVFDEPEAAVLRAGEQDFDVVISDYRMPGLNGAEATGAVLAAAPETKVICLTASVTSEEIDEVLAAGAIACMTKDGDFDLLVRKVCEAASA